jgi:hypothetical protein
VDEGYFEKSECVHGQCSGGGIDRKGAIMKTDASINARFDAWSVNHKDGFARLSYQRIAWPNSTIMKGLAPPGA